MIERDRHAWARALRALAGTEDRAVVDADTFRDEFGVRRAADPFLVAFVRQAPPPSRPERCDRDIESWHALTSGQTQPPGWVELDGDGPIAADPSRIALETETELELSALHALSRLAQRQDHRDLQSRVRSAALWLIDNVQPDNATGTPWAAHVFIELALGDRDIDDGRSTASAYAQTLIHNCQVQLGRPDRRSALILADAADALTG